MLAEEQLAAAIDTEESVLRGFGGEHALCPQVKGRGVLESETDAASPQPVPRAILSLDPWKGAESHGAPPVTRGKTREAELGISLPV